MLTQRTGFSFSATNASRSYGFRLKRYGAGMLIAILAARVLSAQTLANQATGPTVLRQIIIYGRHSCARPPFPTALSLRWLPSPIPLSVFLRDI